MDRLFLDANVLFSAAYLPETRLLRLWKLRDATLCSSRYALGEARVNLQGQEQLHRLTDLAAQIEFFDSSERSLPKGISLPEKDVPILLAAMSASATHLLTGDLRHFGRYRDKKIEGILVMLPGDYLRLRKHDR